MKTMKILGGILLGVGAIAAVPFTGGGSILGAATLAGTVAAAAAAGAAGGYAASKMAEEDEKQQSRKEQNKYEEGVKSAEEVMKMKFSEFLKTQKHRDEFIVLAVRFGLAIASSDGHIDKVELEELERLIKLVVKNPVTPDSIKNRILGIMEGACDFASFKQEFDMFVSGKDEIFIRKTFSILDEILEDLINADSVIDDKEIQFRKRWNSFKVEYLW